MTFRSHPFPWRKLVSVVAESNCQVPPLSSVKFLVSCHHAISSASIWSVALTFFHQETEDSQALVFRKTDKSRGSLGQDTLRDGDLGLGWFGWQGRAGVFGAALGGLDGRAGQECSGPGGQGARRRWCGGPQGTGAGHVGGLGGGTAGPRGADPRQARSPPTCGCKAVPSSTPALMTQFPAGRESTPEVLCCQLPALCPRAAVTKQACSWADHGAMSCPCENCQT